MADELTQENEQLKRELAELKQSRTQQLNLLEEQVSKEQKLGQTYSDTIGVKQSELDTLKNRVVFMQRSLDEETMKRSKVEAETALLERRVVELHDRASAGRPMQEQQPPAPVKKGRQAAAIEAANESLSDSTKSSTKLMRLVDSWMRQKDLQQALLRGAAINDMGFSTIVQILQDCPSLHTLDLSQNQLTMDSCSDICQLITTSPKLTYLSLEGNKFSLRAIGYFMTAVMERHNSKKLPPIDILDLQGNEGLLASIADGEVDGVPDNLLRRVSGDLPHEGRILVCQVARALWKFLHDTGHPQVKGTSEDEVAFHKLDKSTITKLESALSKVLLVGDDESGKQSKTITADMVFLLPPVEDHEEFDEGLGAVPEPDNDLGAFAEEKTVSLPPISSAQPKVATLGQQQDSIHVSTKKPAIKGVDMTRDPFADLKAAFERPKDKAMTFNLKQIVTKNGMILMNMLERLLETTSINARDVETGQTLLEYACHTGNIGLAKLCYRRGASLSQRTLSGDTPFNIATRNRRYDLMEFLHLYGVKVNSADAQGRTALHIATSGRKDSKEKEGDIDAICRLIEWGADCNLRDTKKKTPLHMACINGFTKATMLLLETGADMNAKDEKEYTAVAHAEANDHFKLMDRLVQLGGKGHGLQNKDLAKSKSAINLGELSVSERTYKTSSLGRIGKVKVPGLWSRHLK